MPAFAIDDDQAASGAKYVEATAGVRKLQDRLNELDREMQTLKEANSRVRTAIGKLDEATRDAETERYEGFIEENRLQLRRRDLDKTYDELRSEIEIAKAKLHVARELFKSNASDKSSRVSR